MLIIKVYIIHHILQSGSTPLHMASWKGHKEVVNILLEAGSNRNIQNSVSSFTYAYAYTSA